MDKPYKYIVVTSVIITALLFWADSDDTPLAAGWRQTLFEIIVWGSMYVLILSLLLSGLYFLYEKIFERARNGKA